MLKCDDVVVEMCEPINDGECWVERASVWEFYNFQASPILTRGYWFVTSSKIAVDMVKEEPEFHGTEIEGQF